MNIDITKRIETLHSSVEKLNSENPDLSQIDKEITEIFKDIGETNQLPPKDIDKLNKIKDKITSFTLLGEEAQATAQKIKEFIKKLENSPQKAVPNPINNPNDRSEFKIIKQFLKQNRIRDALHIIIRSPDLTRLERIKGLVLCLKTSYNALMGYVQKMDSPECRTLYDLLNNCGEVPELDDLKTKAALSLVSSLIKEEKTEEIKEFITELKDDPSIQAPAILLFAKDREADAIAYVKPRPDDPKNPETHKPLLDYKEMKDLYEHIIGHQSDFQSDDKWKLFDEAFVSGLSGSKCLRGLTAASIKPHVEENLNSVEELKGKDLQTEIRTHLDQVSRDLERDYSYSINGEEINLNSVKKSLSPDGYWDISSKQGRANLKTLAQSKLKDPRFSNYTEDFQKLLKRLETKSLKEVTEQIDKTTKHIKKLQDQHQSANRAKKSKLTPQITAHEAHLEKLLAQKTAYTMDNDLVLLLALSQITDAVDFITHDENQRYNIISNLHQGLLHHPISSLSKQGIVGDANQAPASICVIKTENGDISVSTKTRFELRSNYVTETKSKPGESVTGMASGKIGEYEIKTSYNISKSTVSYDIKPIENNPLYNGSPSTSEPDYLKLYESYKELYARHFDRMLADQPTPIPAFLTPTSSIEELKDQFQKKTNLLMSKYSELIKKDPKLVSIDVIKAWTEASKEGSTEDNPSFGLASVPLDVQMAMIKYCDRNDILKQFPEMETNYNAQINEKNSLKDSTTIMDGLGKDFGRAVADIHIIHNNEEIPTTRIFSEIKELDKKSNQLQELIERMELIKSKPRDPSTKENFKAQIGEISSAIKISPEITAEMRNDPITDSLLEKLIEELKKAQLDNYQTLNDQLSKSTDGRSFKIQYIQNELDNIKKANESDENKKRPTDLTQQLATLEKEKTSAMENIQKKLEIQAPDQYKSHHLSIANEIIAKNPDPNKTKKLLQALRIESTLPGWQLLSSIYNGMAWSIAEQKEEGFTFTITDQKDKHTVVNNFKYKIKSVDEDSLVYRYDNTIAFDLDKKLCAVYLSKINYP